MTKQSVERIIKKYQKKLLLESWDFNVILSKDSVSESNAAAEVYCSPVYRFATITIYKDAFKKPNNINNIICHEMCHCLTEKLYTFCYDFLNSKFHSHNDIEDEREFLTEWIAKIVR